MPGVYDLVELQVELVLVNPELVGRADPVVGGAGIGGKRNLCEIFHRNGADQGGIHNVQLPVVHIRVTDEPAMPIRPGGGRVIDLTLEYRPSQRIGSNLRAQQLREITLALEHSRHAPNHRRLCSRDCRSPAIEVHIDHEERLVTAVIDVRNNYRPTEHKAAVVLLILGYLGKKGVACLRQVISDVVVKVPVQLTASRFQGNGVVNAAGKTVYGVRVGGEPNLLYNVRNGSDKVRGSLLVPIRALQAINLVSPYSGRLSVDLGPGDYHKLLTARLAGVVSDAGHRPGSCHRSSRAVPKQRKGQWRELLRGPASARVRG